MKISSSYNYKLNDVASIFVLYRTDLKKFKKVLSLNKKNFSNIFLVNNSPEISLNLFKSKQITLINNSSNIGLAAALNIGILQAKKKGAKMVVLFDQDTLIPDNFLQEMLININSNQYSKKVALFSPAYFNKVTNDYGSIINLKKFRLERSSLDTKKNFLISHYVITSGSFIPMSVLDDVGLMREELFIDLVDTEWCFRARANGYKIILFPKIKITHHLGDSSVTLIGKNYPIHKPVRIYYYFRNSIYLYRLREIDWNWCVVDLARNLLRFLFYILFVKNRIIYFKYIIKGYYHGLINKMGKLEE